MRKIKILWTDDEVEVLKPHILFLREKGFEVDTCSNGRDTLDLVRQNLYDLIFLDENMPGLSGIETLRLVKEIRTDIPVVMITKSEEEEIMKAAIGSEIADYLIKPVKPNQIILVIMKILEHKRLITEKTTTDYRLEFNRIGSLISSASTCTEWIDLYKRLVFWEFELEKSFDPGMAEILKMQENEANISFARFITRNYLTWLERKTPENPVLSPDLFSERIFPFIDSTRPLFFILVDNLRFDHWKTISAELAGIYRIVDDDIYFSILPTTTQYSRNAIFAGMMPSQIAGSMPHLWVDEGEDEGKNNFEKELFSNQLKRKGLNFKWSYSKISTLTEGKKINEKINLMLDNDLNILVFNFVDILSHARTDNSLIRDLAEDESAYRSLVRSWFLHSSLFEMLKILSSHNIKIIVSTDHGSVKIQNPVKVIGDKNTSTNIRYKAGRNLSYEPDQVFELRNPEKAMLPKTNISSKYIFATNKDFLLFPKNFNYYAGYFRNTFQHGGISLQEMLLPVTFIEPV